VKDHLDEIDAEQAKLDSIDEQLRLAIEAINATLRDRLHTRVEIPCEGAKFSKIAFCKLYKVWVIGVEIGGDWQSLGHASREVRAEALAGDHVRRLVAAASADLRAVRSSRDPAIKAAADLLAQLGAALPKPAPVGGSK
jgi:hypothetical protein